MSPGTTHDDDALFILTVVLIAERTTDKRVIVGDNVRVTARAAAFN